MNFCKAFVLSTCVIFLTLSLSQTARAQQSTTGAIVGAVSDSSGAVLPGVTVTVTSAAMIGKRAVTTGSNGEYRIAPLDPGDYKLAFSIAGFGPVAREGITITVGFTATINVTMGAASLTQDR